MPTYPKLTAITLGTGGGGSSIWLEQRENTGNQISCISLAQ